MGGATSHTTDYLVRKQLVAVLSGLTDIYSGLVISAALASGVIHWHCKYEPLSDGAFVRPA